MTRTLITTLLAAVLVAVNCFTQPIAIPYRAEATLFPVGVDGKWGYADEHGDIQIELRFSDARLFHYGLAAARQDGGYGYINELGEWQIEPRYDSAGHFYYSCAEVVEQDEKFYINRYGKKMDYADCELSRLIWGCNVHFPPVSPGQYSVRRGDKYALTYKQTRDTTAFLYDGVRPFNRDYILVEKDGRVGFHYIYVPRDHIGELYFANALHFPYEEIVVRYRIQAGGVPDGDIRYAAVKKNGRWGLLKTGTILKEVVEPQYLSMERNLEENFILVEYEEGKFGYIDQEGREYFK